MIIPPNRHEVMIENGLPSLRLISFMEDLAETVNSLEARSINTQDGNYTFLITDALTIVRNTDSTGTYTIPANTSVEFELGHVLKVQNDGGTLTIACDDTLTFEADNTTGTRTIAAGGSGRFVKVAETQWKARGEQMT